jgi:hypothetical protein
LNIAHAAARRLSGESKTPGATIAFMAKFKPAKAKKPTAPAPQGAVPCVILVILAIAGVMLLLFFVMKSSSGT